MKNVIIVVLFLIPNLLHGQENKPKFYDRLQIVPDFQIEKQKLIHLTSNPHVLNGIFKEELIFNTFISCGVNITFKNKFFSTGIGYDYLINTTMTSSDNIHRIQYNLSGNILFFLKASSNKLGIYLGPSFLICNDFIFYEQMLGLGYGVEFSIFNIWIKFSRYNKNIVKYDYYTTLDKSFLFSIGYGIDLNLFRKNEKKRYDL